MFLYSHTAIAKEYFLVWFFKAHQSAPANYRSSKRIAKTDFSNYNQLQLQFQNSVIGEKFRMPGSSRLKVFHEKAVLKYTEFQASNFIKKRLK